MSISDLKVRVGENSTREANLFSQFYWTPGPVTLHASDVLCLVPYGTAALHHGAYLSDAFGARLHVLPLPRASGDTLTHSELTDLLTSLDTNRLQDDAVVVPDVEPGGVATIEAYSNDVGGDLIVTHTTTPEEATAPLSDEITSFLLEELNVPIYFAGHVNRPQSLQQILVPTDFSAHSLDALHNAAGLAELYDLPLDVLHVTDSIPYVALTRTDRLSLGSSSLSEHRGRRQVRAFLREGYVSNVSTRSHVAYGTPADQITGWIEKHEDSLLVLSSHGTANQPERPLGHVAEQVLNQSGGPTLVVRAFGPSLLKDVAPADSATDQPD